MVNSIDIIIPSFRAQPEYVMPILNLVKPPGWIIRFYLIIDNPYIKPDKVMQDRADAGNLTLIINNENKGASLTRNTGIDSSNGEWILFLDDDIDVKPDLLNIYKQAIDQYKNEIGFIGLITLPPALSAFTRAISASGAINIFSVASGKEHFAWGATANIMINRKAIGNIRFSPMYPKAGGGEDVDFFLKVRKANNYKDFKTLKEAEVWHPWWNEGKITLKRSFRYGQGTAWLIKLNPEYTRYDFPSTPEILLISLLLLLLSLLLNTEWVASLAIFILGSIIIEIAANYVNSSRNKNRISVPVLIYVILLKIFYDAGIVWTNISQGFLRGIGKRFNDNGSLKKDHFIRFNRYKITKVLLYAVLITFLVKHYSS